MERRILISIVMSLFVILGLFLYGTPKDRLEFVEQNVDRSLLTSNKGAPSEFRADTNKAFYDQLALMIKDDPDLYVAFVYDQNGQWKASHLDYPTE